MITGSNKQHFASELTRLFDADRIHQEFGSSGEEQFVKELKEYYERLSDDEKEAFQEAVQQWLQSTNSLREMQSIRLCGDLRLKGCIDNLLRLGEQYRREMVPNENLNWIIQSLGQIGDSRAASFLMDEATTGEYRIGALDAISMIDFDLALKSLPAVIDRFYQAGDSTSTEILFRLFLAHSKHRNQAWVTQQLGSALRDFADKEYLIDQFRKALHLNVYPSRNRRLTPRKQKLLDKFRGLLK